jgi:hypothetical protein
LIDIGILLASVTLLDFGEPVMIDAGQNRSKGQPKK